jgi:glyoxylase-like metal-dependent hydrolase (beta-lactamase superfamily II)
VMLTPGHSPGSICIWWPRESALISGDVIFDHGVGRTDLPGGNPKELAKGIDRLSKLTFDLLLPGHGNPIQGDNKNESNFRFIRKMYFGGS